MKTYAEKRFFEYHEDDVAVSIRAKSGSYGGGVGSVGYCSDIVGPLCARDWKGVGIQFVREGKIVVTRYESTLHG